MITEALLGIVGLYTYINWDKFVIRKRWKEITNSKSTFTNSLDKTLKLWHIERVEYGHILKVELPYSYTFDKLEGDIDVFKEGLHYATIQLHHEGNMVTMYCIKNYKFKDYVPSKLPANKLLIADGLINPIVVDMNKFPHMLIGGSTGTGKSRILLLILTNLIKYCRNVDIYLLQIRKNDLGVFNNCCQVKINSKTFQEVFESLQKIDIECLRREKLIDNTKGYYNIEDYNKSHFKLKYIYVVIEEFSFLNVSKGDSMDDKRLKLQCLKFIKTIVNVGRSSGVFLITALQKPTSDSLPTDIKDQLCTRIALRITDNAPSIVILGTGKATELQEREVICRTLDEEQGYSYTIDHQMVAENIKHMVVEKKAPKIKEDSIDDILSKINEITK